MYFRCGNSNVVTAWRVVSFSLLIALIPSHVLATSTEISGVVEVQIELVDDFDGSSSSNILIDNAEFSLDSELTEWFSSHFSFLYERFFTTTEVDNVYIEYGNLFLSSLFLRAGQLYVPFGAFETNMVTDPFTLFVAETREVAFTLGYESSFHATMYFFNGELLESGGDDSIDNIGVDLGYIYQGESVSVDIGFGYINNIGESIFLNEIITENKAGVTEIVEYVPGMITHLIFQWGSFQFIGELAAATKDFAVGEIHVTQKSRPSATNLELAYHFSDNWVLALGTQNSVDMSGYLPESRLLFATTYRMDQATKIGFEYISDSDYGSSEPNGTGNSGSKMRIQLTAEF
ncbi:LbtU family siderophore porin [Kaarinaea lacus]